MITNQYLSWGRCFKYIHDVYKIYVQSDIVKVLQGIKDKKVLAYGLGRSYGDSCLNENGALLDMSELNKFISFDPTSGILKCEGGTSLGEILRFFVPKGWFLPVTPGTKYVTVGGAIANDVHGKNHHCKGTFGLHVNKFELIRSDGSKLICSKQDNSDLFYATVGGLGLTGVISWAEIKLQKISSAFIYNETIKFNDLWEFFKISEESDKDFEYTVAWIDCLASGKNLGRGLFMRGNHADKADLPSNMNTLYFKDSHFISIPIDAPSFLLNNLFIKLFNTLFYNKNLKKINIKFEHYDSFFYPLDKIFNWNRMYGKRGLLQYQFVIPESQIDKLQKIFEIISASGMASFLAVLKKFGTHPKAGLLSFPEAGYTLALDFANHGQHLSTLFKKLDEIVLEAQGKLYPAKDAKMSSLTFSACYPQKTDFEKFIDPNFSSSFWRRVNSM